MAKKTVIQFPHNDRTREKNFLKNLERRSLNQKRVQVAVSLGAVVVGLCVLGMLIYLMNYVI